jgi:MFS family permease
MMNDGPGVFVVALLFLLSALILGLVVTTFPGWLMGKTTARKHRREGRTLRINSLIETKPRRWTLTAVGFLWFSVLLSTALRSQTGGLLTFIVALSLAGLAIGNYGAFFIAYTASTERLAHRWDADND